MDARAESAYPKLELANDDLRVSIFLPDAERGYYRGTRFDWSGIIERVDHRGHRFYAPLHETHDPRRHDSVSGPVDEFAMFEPMGFAEAGAGESFVKIGVGLLAKGRGDEYRFHGDYALLRNGEWHCENGADWVRFEQHLTAERGWGYRYRKTIRLTAGEPGFTIEYRLDNSGSRTVDIDHYNHNFTRIDEMPYGPEYSVELAISTEEARPIGERAWFRGNRIQVERPLADESLWIELYRGEPRRDYNAAVVRHDRSGAAVSFVGDAPVERFVFWAVERAACPEPFSRILLRPGESKSWSSRYRFSVDDR